MYGIHGVFQNEDIQQRIKKQKTIYNGEDLQNSTLLTFT